MVWQRGWQTTGRLLICGERFCGIILRHCSGTSRGKLWVDNTVDNQDAQFLSFIEQNVLGISVHHFFQGKAWGWQHGWQARWAVLPTILESIFEGGVCVLQRSCYLGDVLDWRDGWQPSCTLPIFLTGNLFSKEKLWFAAQLEETIPVDHIVDNQDIRFRLLLKSLFKGTF